MREEAVVRIFQQGRGDGKMYIHNAKHKLFPGLGLLFLYVSLLLLFIVEIGFVILYVPTTIFLPQSYLSSSY